MFRRFFFSGLTASLGLALSSPTFACASCGCTLNSDWENLGYSTTSGIKLDLRYDYLDQNQLRSGSGTLSSVAASQRSNDGNPQEVEKYTRNQYVTMSGDYSTAGGWGITVQVPYILRKHETLGTASDGVTAGAGGGQYVSDTSDFGDIKLIGRYAGFSPEQNWGLLFGLKLPTGRHTETGISTDPTAPGPVAIDRGLQPGTGTTDGIIGAFYSQRVSKRLAYFANATYQQAFDTADQYRPGDGTNLTLGMRYMLNPIVTPQLQLNARYVRHDTGAQADIYSTGGTLVYASPGVSVRLDKRASVYTFVQLPVYQHVNGVQLAPRYIASVGLHYSF